MISPQYRVLIPREIRAELCLKPGQEVEALAYDGRIVVIPLRPIRQMRGFLKGIDMTIEREADRI